jgi:hypothetical protein
MDYKNLYRTLSHEELILSRNINNRQSIAINSSHVLDDTNIVGISFDEDFESPAKKEKSKFGSA